MFLLDAIPIFCKMIIFSVKKQLENVLDYGLEARPTRETLIRLCMYVIRHKCKKTA